MNGLFDLIRGLFSNIFGLIILFAGLQWIYRNVINARRSEGGSTNFLSNVRRTFNEFDMGATKSTDSDIVDVGSSDRGRVAFTERDMYVNVVEERMTYSLGSTENFDNPKELYDAGLITWSEYIRMVPNRKRGGR